jgi:hemerythrin
MQRLLLTDELITGVEAVDEQHRQLFAWGNALLFPGSAELDATELNNGLIYLDAYVGFHFATEERAMHQAGYPRADAHHWQHTHFRREIRQLAERGLADGPSRPLALQLHYLLYDWFAGHIRFSDSQFAAWMRDLARPVEVQPVTRQAMVQLGLEPALVKVFGPGVFRG